jgi:FkbM family methyltransferase
MSSLKNRVSSLLPNGIKALLRPIHDKAQQMFGGAPVDASSMLAIQAVDGFDVAYRKGTADELVLRDSFSHDIFYSGVPEYHPAENDVIIDIGAHIGTFSLLSSSRARLGRVYAVEASQDTFNLLRINVALNHITNISVHHVAIAEKEGQVTLYHDRGNWGHSIVKPLSAFSETVESTTLTRFMEKNGIRHCHFMKFNCEGAEFPIVLGTSQETLSRIGITLILYHCDLWGKNTEADLVAHLHSAGFTCAIRNKTPQRGWIIGTNTAGVSP